MICPTCGTDTPAPFDRCFRCSTPFPIAAPADVTLPPQAPGSRPPIDAPTVAPASVTTIGFSLPSADGAQSPSQATMMAPGSAGFGLASAGGGSSPSPEGMAAGSAMDSGIQIGEMFGRYRIIRLLGAGGMGQVYQAWDQELGEAVALKTIRPEYAANADADARFKRELSVARQVTHKNVVRIHDLGLVGNVKYISMSFIEGIDLATMIANEPLPREIALSIVRQVCEGLASAHQAGIAHRDLKPANIMIDKAGQAYLMDFGLARSVEATQYTSAGMVMGTIEYMSPEQAMGQMADQRSDIYTLGIILFELFTGQRPFTGENPMSRLSARLHVPAPDPRTIKKDVPPYLAKIILRCLERDADQRYQKVEEIIADFDAHQAAARPWRLVWRRWGGWKIAAGAAAVVVVGLGLAVVRPFSSNTSTSAKPVASGPTVSLAILPFRNASGDEKLAWLGPNLAEMLRTEVGQSSYLRSVSSARLDQVLKDLRIGGNSTFDDGDLRRLAEFSDAETLVSGQYSRFGDRIRIDATLRDLKRDRSIPLKIEAPSEKDLPKAIGDLAQLIQQSITTSPDVIKELRATALKPSSTSVQALRYYNEGLQLARQGNRLEALKRFQASVQEDQDFALAHANLGQTYGLLGYDSEAEQSSRRAVNLAEKLSPQEKYLVGAIHARTSHDTKKAIESYENLVKVLPEDSDIWINLAGLYESTAALDKAREAYAHVLQRDPKHVDALLATGRIEIRRRNPQGALDSLTKALNLANLLEKDQQKADILQAMGIAYRRLDKRDEALRNYQQSLDIKRRIGDKRGMAASLTEIAKLSEAGKSDEALKSYQEALTLRRDIGDKSGTAGTLTDLAAFVNDRGRPDEALTYLKEAMRIQRELGNAIGEALALNNIGSAYLTKGQFEDALTYYQRALDLREKANIPSEVAQTLYNLGEVATNLGQYDDALKYRFRAIETWRKTGERRGVAQGQYAIGVVATYQGRYGAALSAQNDALKIFRELRDQFWLGYTLDGQAKVLAAIGKADDARASLDEALTIARAIKNQDLVAQTLAYQGDTYYAAGDVKGAQKLYDQAIAAAAKSTDRALLLQLKVNAAKVAVKERRGDAVAALKKLGADADTAGLKFLSNECALVAAEGLMNAGQRPAARQELERAIARSERLGLREIAARSHYLLSAVLRSEKNAAEASRHLAEARRALEEIRKESGSDDLLRRADLSPILTPPAAAK